MLRLHLVDLFLKWEAGNAGVMRTNVDVHVTTTPPSVGENKCVVFFQRLLFGSSALSSPPPPTCNTALELWSSMVRWRPGHAAVVSFSFLVFTSLRSPSFACSLFALFLSQQVFYSSISRRMAH